MTSAREHFTEQMAVIAERARALGRARLCKSRVARYPRPGTERHEVRIDGREVGYVARAGQAPMWCAVYTVDEAPVDLGSDHGKPAALMLLKVHTMLEDERRVVAELDVAVDVARWVMPNGILIRAGLREIRAGLLAGVMSPAVATMNAVHILAHVTGVNASR